MKKNLSLAIFVIVAILIVYSFAQREKDAQIKNETTLPAVRIQALEAGQLNKTLHVSGTLQGQNEADVISETGGKVTAVIAEIGTWLAKGQVIVQIENDLQEVGLEQARAQEMAAQTNYDKALADLKRVENLYNEKVTTPSDLENARLGARAAEAQLKGAQAALKQAQKQYDHTIITAPLSGRLADRFVEMATMVTPGARIAVVVDARNMKLKSSVAEREIALLSKNAPAVLTADAIPGKEFKGKVISVAQKANNEHNYAIDILVTNDNGESLKSGMFGRAVIDVANISGAVVIPATAILMDAQKNRFVFVEKDGAVSRIEIVTGIEHDGKAQVTRGLTFGDRLVIAGQQGLTDGARVIVK
jgi:membrane fusion protein (multidrug efflux system)